MLTATEVFLDGSEQIFPAYKVRNPTDHDIVFGSGQAKRMLPTGQQQGGAHGLFLQREGPMFIGLRSDGTKKYANRFLDLTIPARGTAIVVEDVLNALLQLRCVTCGLPFRFARLATVTPRRRGTAYCHDE